MPEAGSPAGPAAAEDRALLEAAAVAAGEVALAHHGRPVAIREKGDGQGPVSEADLAVNAALAERLRHARPDYGWLSEEDVDGHGPGAARSRARRVFVVDPIDGTRAFLAGEAGWGVAVAVVEDGRPVAACFHLPARDETYAAHLGGGASLNGRPISMSDRTALIGARGLAGKAALSPEHWPGGVPEIVREMRPALIWRLCLVAEGRADLALTLGPAWEWDVAAGALIAAEAGAAATDPDGRQLAFNRTPPRTPGVIVAPPALHAALMARRRS